MRLSETVKHIHGEIHSIPFVHISILIEYKTCIMHNPNKSIKSTAKGGEPDRDQKT